MMFRYRLQKRKCFWSLMYILTTKMIMIIIIDKVLIILYTRDK